VFFLDRDLGLSGVDCGAAKPDPDGAEFHVPFHAIVTRVIWPGALPSILAGFRITASVALLLVSVPK
jgi:NitT/TauT family transport system permease protein